jgi:hypothetical protein
MTDREHPPWPAPSAPPPSSRSPRPPSSNESSIVQLFYSTFVRSNARTIWLYRRGTTFSAATSNRCLRSSPGSASVASAPTNQIRR